MVSISKSAGSFLGGITNNPGSVIILLGLGALLLFKKDISGALSGLGQVNVNLPDVNLPEIPQFVSNFFGRVDPNTPTPRDILEQSGATTQQIDIAKANDDLLIRGIPIPTAIQSQIDEDFENDPNRDPNRFVPTGRLFTGREEDRPIEITETVAPAIGATSVQNLLDMIKERDLRMVPEEEEERQVMQRVVQSEINGQQFFGGGSGFVGGTVFETPITGESSLGFIIDKLGVSASRAASIRAEARGFSPEEEAFLNQPGTIGGMENQVFNNSSGGFSGMTPEQIARQLTGGVISNF